MEKVLRTMMPDGSRWDVPVSIIAYNRAQYYAHEFDGDAERSLNEDTLPLFKDDPFEIEDWAANDMDWRDVERFARKVVDTRPVDYQRGWVNGHKEIVDVEEG